MVAPPQPGGAEEVGEAVGVGLELGERQLLAATCAMIERRLVGMLAGVVPRVHVGRP